MGVMNVHMDNIAVQDTHGREDNRRRRRLIKLGRKQSNKQERRFKNERSNNQNQNENAFQLLLSQLRLMVEVLHHLLNRSMFDIQDRMYR